MDNNEQNQRILNGRSVMNAIMRLGNQATVANLSKCIANSTDQHVELIRPEVKRVLIHGISNGFLVKQGQHYLLAGQNELYQVDKSPPSDPSDKSCDYVAVDDASDDDDDDPFSELAQFVEEYAAMVGADIEIMEIDESEDNEMTNEEFLQAQAELIAILEGDDNVDEATDTGDKGTDTD